MIVGFDSILVRLKVHLFRPLPLRTGEGFDSILVRLKVLAKATVILYPVLVGRVKSIIISHAFKTRLLSTSDCANSLGVRRILTKRGTNEPFS